MPLKVVMKTEKEILKTSKIEEKAKKQIELTEKSVPSELGIFFDRDKFHFKPDYFMIPKGIVGAFEAHDVGRDYRFSKTNPVWHFCISFVLSYVKYNQITLGKKEVRVSVDLLEFLFGKDVYLVMRFLQETKTLLKSSNHSTQIRRCRGYILNEKLLDKKNWEQFEFTEKLKSMQKYQNVKKKLLKGLCIQEDKNLAKLKNDPKFDSGIHKKVRGDESKIFERINKDHKNIKMDRSCRIHHNYTNLRKDLRKKATYDGEQLMECDIKSCQPLLLAALYGDNKKVDGATLYFEKEKLSKEEQLEKDRYVDFCIHGKGFYATLGISKSEFGFTMFGNLHPKAWFKLKMIQGLKERFPILVGRLYGLRRCLKRYKDGKPFYGLVATFMQRWESYIMIDNAFKEMTFGAIPIHDSVLIRKEHKHEAIDIIVRAFASKLGIKKLAINITHNNIKKRQQNFVSCRADLPSWMG